MSVKTNAIRIVETAKIDYTLHSYPCKEALDALTVAGKISEINDTFKTVFVKGIITNQNGKKVCKANIQLGVRE